MPDLALEWLSPVGRVVLLYGCLLVFVRLSGKRQLAQLTPMDLLTMLLVSETVSPALTAGDNSIPTALIAAGSLFALTLAMARFTYRSRTFERFTEGAPRELVRQGRVDETAMKAERITRQELDTARRKAGIPSLKDVVLAVVEPDGEITFLEAKDVK